ncbi:MAG: hypothetical protein C4332_14140, partial [Meiothermus sp.]
RNAAYDTVLAEILRRDKADAAQSAPARDAVLLDTSHLDLDGVVNAVLEHIKPPSAEERSGVKTA